MVIHIPNSAWHLHLALTLLTHVQLVYKYEYVSPGCLRKTQGFREDLEVQIHKVQ